MSNVVVIKDLRSDALQTLQDWLTERDELLAKSSTVAHVTTDTELEDAGKVQAEISRHIKKLGHARLEVTRPLDDCKKAIIEQEKAMVADLEKSLTALTNMNKAYAMQKAREAEEARRAEESRRREEAERQMAAERAAQEKARSLFGQAVKVVEQPAEPLPSVQPAMPAGPKTSSNSFVETWKFDIVDADKVPRELCSVDESKIRTFLQYQKKLGRDLNDVSVAGLRLYKDMQIRNR